MHTSLPNVGGPDPISLMKQKVDHMQNEREFLCLPACQLHLEFFPASIL